MRRLSKWFNSSKKKPLKGVEESSNNQTPLISELSLSIEMIKKDIGHSSDIIFREVEIGKEKQTKIAIIYADGLVDRQFIHEFILNPLMLSIRETELNDSIGPSISISELMKQYSLTTGELKFVYDYESVNQSVLSGDTVIILDGEVRGFSVGTRGWEGRSVEEPSTEQVVRGPKDGFTENIRTNTALIRRRIRDKNLVYENFQIGKRSKTDVTIGYLKDIADKKIVQEIRERLDRIDIDLILEGGYIEEFIQDETYSPFPTIYNTERPDVVAAGLMEGRIVILVDGSPFVLLVPALFNHFMQSSEDYYQRPDISTMIRILRYTAFLLSLLVPSAYIAVTTFHQEMLPTALLISLSAQREGVPFPAVIEALIMEVTFEILREAGLRMPRAIGSAISIVGALVIGQAAVEAGLISATMVIVVSFTAICSFVIPKFNMSIATRMLRFGFMILAATFGLFGIILGLLFMVLHLSSLRSFGVPYLAPFAPTIASDLHDTIYRTPLWNMKSRPQLINQEDVTKNETPAPHPKGSSEKSTRGESSNDNHEPSN
ncbi:spore germination protein [Bacillus luteolus]|uniref:Spore germination protein n=1 Tax=Litchfieldia luteola TaxID=682179 RepID=A0ABR9QFS4_9BACI|nr:spore germination protein [Cytobacillus luteolus]MBE4907335.1 spore germination protein [Cytobacillus luteolus]MBP1943882.1 spore germination protein KA [Cytobacillus luteolus]